VVVTAVNISSGGSGYTTVPKVTFTGGGGSGAAATAVLTATSVSGIAIDAPGYGYSSAPTITFSSGTAAASATIQGGGVQAVIVDNQGTGYTANHPPTISFSGGGGSGTVAKALVTNGKVTGVLVTNPGSGYASAPAVTINSPTHHTATGASTIANGAVTSVTVTDGGGYYNTPPAITFTGGLGSGAEAVAEIFGGRVYRVVVIQGGTGYTSAPTVTFAAPSGGLTQATARATLGGVAIAVDSNAGPVVLGDIVPLSAKLTVWTNAASTKGIVIRGAASQSANLYEVQDNSGNVLLSIGAAGALTGSLDDMTFANPLTVDVTKGTLHKTLATNDATFNASAAGNAGQEMTLPIRNDASAARTITFGTNFKAAGNLTGTVGKFATVRFVSDGTNWYEVSRATNL
jgi:hypothetical protein